LGSHDDSIPSDQSHTIEPACGYHLLQFLDFDQIRLAGYSSANPLRFTLFLAFLILIPFFAATGERFFAQ
jgi:hypothetical protein